MKANEKEERKRRVNFAHRDVENESTARSRKLSITVDTGLTAFRALGPTEIAREISSAPPKRGTPSSVVRQKFHDIRWRVSFGGALAIGPRLGSQRLVFDLVLMVAQMARPGWFWCC